MILLFSLLMQKRESILEALKVSTFLAQTKLLKVVQSKA